MKKTSIVVSVNHEGVHRWKDCDIEEVSFLRNYHRHVFYFEVKVEVSHNNRDIEFIQFKRKVEEQVADLLREPTDSSCEMLCEALYERLNLSGRVSIGCFEDNENGAVVEWD